MSGSPPRGMTTSQPRGSATIAASSSRVAQAGRRRPRAARPPEAVAHAAQQHGVGVARARGAAQQAGVAALEAEAGDVDRDVGARLVDDEQHAERNAHLLDVEPVRQPPAASRPRHGSSSAAIARTASHSATAPGVERQPVEQRAGWPAARAASRSSALASTIAAVSRSSASAICSSAASLARGRASRAARGGAGASARRFSRHGHRAGPGYRGEWPRGAGDGRVRPRRGAAPRCPGHDAVANGLAVERAHAHGVARAEAPLDALDSDGQQAGAARGAARCARRRRRTRARRAACRSAARASGRHGPAGGAEARADGRPATARAISPAARRRRSRRRRRRPRPWRRPRPSSACRPSRGRSPTRRRAPGRRAARGRAPRARARRPGRAGRGCRGLRIGEQHEQPGAQQQRDLGGQRVVVAERDLVGRRGVVLVDDRDDVPGQQRLERGAGVQVAGAPPHVVGRQQHLRARPPAMRAPAARPGQQALPDRRGGLQPGHVARPHVALERPGPSAMAPLETTQTGVPVSCRATSSEAMRARRARRTACGRRRAWTTPA